eukprot:5564672-Pyramimonas_sp.AAC.1
MRLPHHLRHVPHALRGPMGSPTESGTHNALLTTTYGWALRQDNFDLQRLDAARGDATTKTV